MKPDLTPSRTCLCMFLALVVLASSQLCAQSPAPSREAGDQFNELHVHISPARPSLKNIFAAVEQQTRFTFVYMKDNVALDEHVMLADSGYSLHGLLSEVSRSLGLVFTRVDQHIVVARAPSGNSRTVRLTGTVRDRSTNDPLVFANVLLEGTQHGTTTDANGRFSIDVLQGPCSVRCGFVGFKTEVVPITVEGDADLTIGLTAMDVVLQDVTVFAHRLDDGAQPEVNALTLQSETIKHVTSIIPDVMRSVQMLPGVSTNNEFSSKFNVRGGNQDENLVVVNGTQVYDPFHIKEMSNASIGIFNADMIRKMDLITGGFTARYGDKMSSVLNIEYREGNRTRYTGSASISMVDLNALVEGPLGENGSFILGGRKSYFEYVMKLVDAGPYFHPSFYDVQGVFAYSLGRGDKIQVKLIHSGDDFYQDAHREDQPTLQWTGYDNTGTAFTNTQRSTDSVDSRAGYYSNMAAAQYTKVVSSDVVLKTEVSLYDQREEEYGWRDNKFAYKGENSRTVYFYNSTTEYLISNALHIRTLEANATVDVQLTSAYGIKTGLSYQHIGYDQERIERQTIDESTNQYHFPDTTSSHRSVNPADDVNDGINARAFKTAAFLENSVQVTDRLLVNAGGRVDYFTLNKDLTMSPRLNASLNAGAGVVFRAAWGHYYQSPIYRQIAYAAASDTNTQSQHAVHLLLGVNYDLMLDRSSDKFVRVKVEGFQKKYDKLVTANVTSQGAVYYSRRNDADGTAHGVDMQLIYSAPRFYGWISYGYLFARQTSVIGGVSTTFPRYTDQRHTIAVTGEFDCGREWSVNSRFVYGSGYPYTSSHAVVDPVKRMWTWITDPVPNSQHLPSYSRVDVKVAKNFTLGGSVVAAFVDVSNLFNTTNIQAYRYRFNNTGKPYREDIKLWPILPTFGLAVKF